MPENVWAQLASLITVPRPEPINATQEEVVALFGELRAPLLRYLRTLGLPVSDGEDVVQETFLALFGHLAAGKPRDNLHGWIFRVARNLALKKRQKNGESLLAPDHPAMPDTSDSPEQHAIRRQQTRAVQNAVAALSELDRQCLHLRAEGLKYREIAEALEVSLGTVAQAISRALDKLARAAMR